MTVRALFIAQMILLAITALLYVVGLALYLYWVLWWYDILLHMLGGAWVALATMWLFTQHLERCTRLAREGGASISSHRVNTLLSRLGAECTFLGFKKGWALIIAMVIAVGIAWEVFEMVVGFPRESNYILDTSLDLLMDVVGAFFGMEFVRRGTALSAVIDGGAEVVVP